MLAHQQQSHHRPSDATAAAAATAEQQFQYPVAGGHTSLNTFGSGSGLSPARSGYVAPPWASSPPPMPTPTPTPTLLGGGGGGGGGGGIPLTPPDAQFYGGQASHRPSLPAAYASWPHQGSSPSARSGGSGGLLSRRVPPSGRVPPVDIEWLLASQESRQKELQDRAAAAAFLAPASTSDAAAAARRAARAMGGAAGVRESAAAVAAAAAAQQQQQQQQPPLQGRLSKGSVSSATQTLCEAATQTREEAAAAAAAAAAAEAEAELAGVSEGRQAGVSALVLPVAPESESDVESAAGGPYGRGGLSVAYGSPKQGMTTAWDLFVELSVKEAHGQLREGPSGEAIYGPPQPPALPFYSANEHPAPQAATAAAAAAAQPPPQQQQQQRAASPQQPQSDQPLPVAAVRNAAATPQAAEGTAPVAAATTAAAGGRVPRESMMGWWKDGRGAVFHITSVGASIWELVFALPEVGTEERLPVLQATWVFGGNPRKGHSPPRQTTVTMDSTGSLVHAASLSEADLTAVVAYDSRQNWLTFERVMHDTASLKLRFDSADGSKTTTCALYPMDPL